MLKCKFCNKDSYSLINDYCHNCYYSWFGFPLGIKIGFIMIGILCSIQLILLSIGLLGGF
jgi:hypothetical protein